MSRSYRRRGVFLGAFGLALVLAGASIAWACSPQATIDMHDDSGVAGDVISGTGNGFSSLPTASEVEVHLDALDGSVVWSGGPNAIGRVSFSFAIPKVEPGYHTVIVTQYENGEPATGTPARAMLQVLASNGSPQTNVAAPPSRESAGQRSQKPSGTAPGRQTAQRVTAATEGHDVASAAGGTSVASASAAGEAPARGNARAVDPHRAVLVAPADAAQTQEQPLARLAASGSGADMIALLLVLGGVALTVAAAAMVVAGRRSFKAMPATMATNPPVTREPSEFKR